MNLSKHKTTHNDLEEFLNQVQLPSVKKNRKDKNTIDKLSIDGFLYSVGRVDPLEMVLRVFAADTFEVGTPEWATCIVKINDYFEKEN